MSTWMLIGLLAVVVFSLLHRDYRQFRDKAEAEDRFEKSVRQWEEREELSKMAEDSRSRHSGDPSRL